MADIQQATMTAPTEAEIREAIEAAISGADVDLTFDDIPGAFRCLAQLAAGPLIHAADDTLEASRGTYEPLREHHEDALWTDLRPSQAVDLRDAVVAAYDRVEARCSAILLEELVAAGLTFARKYPDAPRPKVPVTA